MKLLKLTLILAAILSLHACGKKKAPRPPEDFAPRQVRFLNVSAGVDSVVFRWLAPTENADGDELLDLDKFSLKKREVEGDAEVKYQTLASVDLVSNHLENLDHEYSFVDAEVEPGKIYDYQVEAVNTDGEPTELPQRIRVVFTGQTSGIEIR